jgi:hypothetical protein
MAKKTTTTTTTTGRRQLVSSAKFWDFREQGTFTGTYLHDVLGEDPNKPGEKKVIGFSFANQDGEEWVISSCYAVAKALETEIEGKLVKNMKQLLEITWVEKIEREGKPSYNRFQIDLLD